LHKLFLDILMFVDGVEPKFSSLNV